MKQLNKLKQRPEECEHCGALWRVKPQGQIEFFPRSPAVHLVCDKCMKAALKTSAENKKKWNEAQKVAKDKDKAAEE